MLILAVLAPLHYADSQAWVCQFSAGPDCPNGSCVVTAIANYTVRLRDDGPDVEGRLEALKFLIHFVGDVHQPLQ